MTVKLKKIKLWKGESWPIYFYNWSKECKVQARNLDTIDEVFYKTTNGKMIFNKEKDSCQLVFDNEQDATIFLLRYS